MTIDDPRPAMRHLMIRPMMASGLVFALSVGFVLAVPLPAVSQAAETAAAPAVVEAVEMTAESLVARIALYPDPLLELVLQAATLPLQVIEADRFLQKRRDDPRLAPKPNWDSSIVGLLNYPQVVTMMSGDLDWTQALGEAVMIRLAEVQDAIQQFRSEVHAAGRLVSDQHQLVQVTAESIRIEPAQPDVIYVPSYDADAVVAATVAPQTAATTSTVVVAEPAVTYYEPAPSYWSDGAAFIGGAVVGGVLGYAIATPYRYGGPYYGYGRPGVPAAGAPGYGRPGVPAAGAPGYGAAGVGVAGASVSAVGVQSQLRTNASVARGGLPSTTAVASRSGGAGRSMAEPAPPPRRWAT